MQEKTRQKWSALIAQQEASGLSVMEFCDNNQLSPKSFYSRRKILSQSHAEASFIKVRTIKPSVQTNSLQLTIGQASLQIPDDINPQWLGALLQAVSS
ncbi:MAG: IS66 family insertion sequence element accessory protein TnpB [Planctomycetes bacterium]|nr:IS66 family insertion sequence element accessory protein TnpB [Planctomycetota bacterium]